MKLLRKLNTGEIKVIAPFSNDNISEVVKKFLLHFYKELIHKILFEKLDREKLDIFNSNQLNIYYNPRNEKLCFVFYKNDSDISLIKVIESVDNTNFTLIDFMIQTEMKEGDTLYGFELQHYGLYNTNQEIIKILDEITINEKEG